MKKVILSLLLIAAFIGSISAQDVHKLSFASKDNKIELTVSNASPVSAKFVNVKVIESPDWIKMKEAESVTGEISSKEERTFIFNFDVDKSAPVDKEELIKFQVTCGQAEKGKTESWSKEIKIKVGAPDKYELLQNYPNPFNPSTTIGYQLPSDSKTLLKVYDILGREVLTLVNTEQTAGYHEVILSRNDLASGIYLYRITAKSKNSPNEFSAVKKMILLK